MPATFSGPLRLNYLQYSVTSTRQQLETVIRVLEPDDLGGVERPRVVYLLPSTPELSHRSGDGLDEALRHDLHNRHGLVFVAPTYSDWPWMTDLPDQAMFQQLMYFVDEVVPFIDSRYPSLPRLLAGYSKGGSAALQILLRHPELFAAAAAFDSPVMKTRPDQWEMPYFWPNPEHFEDFAIPHLLRTRGTELGDAPRIGLFGYGNFGRDAPEWSHDHLSEAHELLNELGIPHVYDNSRYRAHRWDSGWLPEAVGALARITQRGGSDS
ncbi:alpha/beta hydrolase-fold protein [Microbacterium sp. ARD32]|uniref:alpha/beta hydrolase-fold protein n=1 Tax=Microbacterium sp. ARD32 TaxID=2962577 RepID=UPI00288202D6|nr:alpha/beta hydrolase-fold protein [Microbacterium sp. ARD32]MDT0158803.1 alpha/beta hydrolase-fold protein [Microbacterium sp. ARD32]